MQTDIYDMTRHDTLGWLNAVYDLSASSADPDSPFFYLGGPMTGLPQFNFPEFDRVASKLRAAGYNIVSPAELDSPTDRAAALASPDGDHEKAIDKGWEDFLMRDVVICAMPACQGGIFLPGWEESSGACLESYVLSRLKKQLFTYRDLHDQTHYALTPLDRDKTLKEVI